MKRTATHDLLTYWTGLLAEPANADRAASASTRVQFAVSHSFLLDAQPDRDFPMRISGLRIDTLFMGSMRQAGFLRLCNAADRAPLAGIMTTAACEAAPMVAGLRAAPVGREPIALELILLPLTSGGRTDALLGGLTPAAIPPWYGVEAVTSFALRSWRFLDAPIARDRRRLVPRTPTVCESPLTRRSRFAVIEGGLSAAPEPRPVSGL